MNKSLTILITGTNKGIGFDLVSIFLKRHPGSLIYATARESPAIAQKRWDQLDPSHSVRCKELEVMSPDSINKLVSEIAQEVQKEGRKIDILINNAGFTSPKDTETDIPDLSYAKVVMDTNTLGPLRLTKQLLPYLSDSARVVNVSSLLGGLRLHPQHTQLRFDRADLKEEDIYEGVERYLKAVEVKHMEDYCPMAYATSKMFLNAWSRYVLKWLGEKQLGLCVTPGFCRTPMTKDMDNPFSYSSYSGAMRIYQTAVREDAKSEIFYHRGRISDYVSCGFGLPMDEEVLE